MNAPMDLQARVQQYLTERRRLGFHLRSPGYALPNFARFVEASKHSGALTVELMAQWARQAQGGKASAETLLHLAIVEQTGAGAVLHTHSQAATLLSQHIGQHHPAELLLSDLEMLKGLAGITTHATTVALPVLPNDQNLQRLSATARPLLGKAPQGLLIAGHGLYAWGQDLSSAQRHLEILEFLLEQRWRQLLLEPQELTPTLISGVSHLLLDIEGTTCPVSYVSEMLFPYASDSVQGYLQSNDQKEEVKDLIKQIRQSWQEDAEAAAA
jgi:methylthioribulose-1-phosphate dehydratase